MEPSEGKLVEARLQAYLKSLSRALTFALFLFVSNEHRARKKRVGDSDNPRSIAYRLCFSRVSPSASSTLGIIASGRDSQPAQGDQREGDRADPGAGSPPREIRHPGRLLFAKESLPGRR